jgi:hypothetical protein
MGEKNLCVVGFGDKVICAQVHAHQLICFAVAASYDDDRHSGGFSHLPADIIAVKKRQVNIKQDQIRSLLQDGLHNMVKAARRAGFIPIAAQQSGELLPNFRVIFHNHDFHRTILSSGARAKRSIYRAHSNWINADPAWDPAGSRKTDF